MGDYVKAMQYHKHDLTLARTMGDRLGEAKASGNLGMISHKKSLIEIFGHTY